MEQIPLSEEHQLVKRLRRLHDMRLGPHLTLKIAILLSFVLAGFTVNQCFFAVTLFYLLLLRCLYPMPAWLRTGEKALKEGRYREAEKIFRDALRREIKRGSDDQIAMACFYLADTLKLQSKLSEAYTCYDRAIQIFQLHYGPRDPQVGHVLSMAIECALLSKQLEEVDVLYEKMISSGFLKGRGSLIRRARTLLCLAVSRQARGVEGSEVEKIATEAIEAFEEARLKPNDFYNFARFASDCLFSREAPLPGSSRLYRRIMAVRKKVVPGPLQRDLPARKVEESDTYHGVTVADPYRWLEDHKSREVMDWVDRNNERQLDFFARRPGQNPIETRWTGLDLDSIRTLPFFQEDKYYFNQIPMRGLLPVLYSLKRLDDDPRVVFDPNTWSINDSFDMRGGILSRCGRFVVYGIASDGTDWTELRLYDSYLGVELPDVVRWTRCGYPSWAKDSSGFFYTQFDRLTEGFAPGQPIRSPRVRFHTRGHSQDEDQVVYERPDDPDLLFSTIVTQDGSILFIFTENATANGNGMLLARTGSDPLSPVEVFPLGDSRYSPLTEIVNNNLIVFTDNEAPNGRIVLLDIEEALSGRVSPKELIGETDATIGGVCLADGSLLVEFREGLETYLKEFDLNGNLINDLDLPPLSSKAMAMGKEEVMIQITDPITPCIHFRYDLKKKCLDEIYRYHLDFDRERFVFERVVYPSRDGCEISMIVFRPRDLVFDKDNPTLLTAYGGFGVSVDMNFSSTILTWLELGGVYCEPAIRGGGDYGRSWHLAGKGRSKQTSFDDFMAAAEWLIENKFTSPKRLAVEGYSNGALVVAASITQRPELFAAASIGAGCLDMVRFNRFSMGWWATNEYGSPADPDDFAALYAYSPVHRVRSGGKYPATLIMTGSDDDRVAPFHSYKFAAALADAQGAEAPVLLRVERGAGHVDSGIRTSFITDQLCFLAEHTGIDVLEQLEKLSLDQQG